MSDRSNPLTTGPSRAPARAMLKAVGFSDADLKRPLIGVANTWIEIGPCNFHLRDLAVHVKEGIRAAGGTPMEFNTVSISDGITMGTEGMRASLVSCEVIADSIELVARGIGFDGRIAHGAVTASLLSAVLGMDLPGPGSIFLEQRIRFTKPVYPGDRITARLAVAKVREDKPIVTLSAVVTKADGTRVAEGELVVLVREPATA